MFPDQVLCNGETGTLQVLTTAPSEISWNAPLSGSDSDPVRDAGRHLFLHHHFLWRHDDIYDTTVLQGDASAGVFEDDTLSFCLGDSLVLHGVPGQEGYQWLPGGEWAIDLVVDAPDSRS